MKKYHGEITNISLLSALFNDVQNANRSDAIDDEAGSSYSNKD
jgi:hypothetical protein